MAPIRVVVSDDHPVVRSGIRHVLEREPDIEVVGEAANGIEALRLAMDLAPDVLLLDIEMPGMTGIDVTRAVCAAGLPTRVLAMSAHDDEQYISMMLLLGAVGYLTKDEPHAVIVAAIRGVTQMERGWFSEGSVFEKLGVASRVEAAVRAVREQLV